MKAVNWKDMVLAINLVWEILKRVQDDKIENFVKQKAISLQINLSWYGFHWNSTYMTYLVYTNSAVWFAPPSFSVQALLLLRNVSYLSKCIDLILLSFLSLFFLMFFLLSFTCVSDTFKNIAHPFHVHFRFHYFFKAFHFILITYKYVIII